jgi:2-keto-4-pentenoate hydratase
MRPISESYPNLSVKDAYEIQRLIVHRKISDKEKQTGKKIGLTSLVMQNLLGVHEPDYGCLTDQMEIKDGRAARNRLIQPKIEAEFAFVLGCDLQGPNITAADVIKATEYVAMAFEVVDSRICDWKIKLTDTIADNGSSAMYLLGTKRINPHETDLCAVRVKLFKGDTLQNEGMGKDVMGNPANAVAWLANTLSDHSDFLKKGDIILSGAISAALPADLGDRFSAEFEGIERIDITFV